MQNSCIKFDTDCRHHKVIVMKADVAQALDDTAHDESLGTLTSISMPSYV